MSLKFIYIWQIKEYRLDRFISYLKEAGILSVFYKLKPHKAALSARNLLIILGNTLLFLVLGVLTVQTRISIVFAIILAVLAPFLGFFVTSITVALTSILSRYKKEALINEAKRKVHTSQATFIAITGSYGKTTTKELLYGLISKKYRVKKTEKTINTDVGIAASIVKDLKPSTQFFIAEIGAYKRGEIEKAIRIFKPSYAILTAIGNQHLDLFGSRDDLIAAKSEIFTSLKKGGKAYINKDIKEYRRISYSLEEYTLFSANQPADIAVKAAKSTPNGIKAQVVYGKKTFNITLKLLGAHNLANLLPAIAVASDIGMSVGEIETAVSELKPIPDKLSIHNGISGTTVVSDAGNSNLEGFMSAIETLAQFPQKTKIIVSKGIIELGVEKRKSYKRILEALVKTDIQLFTTDRLFHEMNNTQTKYFPDEKLIIDELTKNFSKDTAVLIEGKFTPGFINATIYP